MAEPLPASIRQIVDRSRSNLAFALAPLPPQSRADMHCFYAFCRVVDDIVDEPGPTRTERELGLAHWESVLQKTTAPTNELEAQVVALLARYSIPLHQLLGIIAGMRKDLDVPKMANQAELDAYCYQAASLVGLVSIRIFGCTQRESIWYAEDLGMALQLTNIIRDVGHDATLGRIYLPQDLLARHGANPADILASRATPQLREALQELSALARTYYAKAKGHRTPEDRPKLLAAETMRRIYSRVQRKIENDGFRVFHRRYRLSKLKKLAFLGLAFAGK